MEYKFPDGFWWGALHLRRNQKVRLMAMEKQKHMGSLVQLEPNRFHEQIGPAETSTFYKNYHQDILMKRIGHNSFRTSISGTIDARWRKINREAVEFYNNVIDDLIENGIEPIFGLFHFDMPLYWQE
jgi:6-phospho-beta-glucosidase